LRTAQEFSNLYEASGETGTGREIAPMAMGS